MNSIFELVKRCHFSLGSVLLSLCALLVPQESFAKPTLSKASVSKISIKSGNSASKKMNRLDCDGCPVWITAENGVTKVYINDEGTEFSKEEKYLFDPQGLDWAQVTIFAGGSGNPYPLPKEVNSPKVKMDGGSVAAIYLGSYTSYDEVKGDAELTVTGGSVGFISAKGYYQACPIAGKANIILSNMIYTGEKQPELCTRIDYVGDDEEDYPIYTPYYGSTNVFINSNVLYVYENAQFSFSSNYGDESSPGDGGLSQTEGAVAPVLTWYMDESEGDFHLIHEMVAINKAEVPAGFKVETGYFHVRSNGYYVGKEEEGVYVENTQFTNNGEIYITSCGSNFGGGMGGFADSSYGQTSVNNGTIKTTPHHLQIPYNSRVADCTNKGTSDNVCQRCGAWVTVETPPLGHVMITDLSRTATCFSTGHTSSTHCIRCKKVGSSKTTGKSSCRYGTEKTYQTTSSSSCYPSGTTYKECTVCHSVTTTATTTSTHSFNTVVSQKSATCTQSGYTTKKCDNCFMTKVTAVSPRHTYGTEVSAKSATCTTSGYPSYYKCTKCNIYSLSKVPSLVYTFNSLDQIEIPALGHDYYGTVLAENEMTEIMSDATRKNAATCTDDEYYYRTCYRCGHISDSEEEVFPGESALGHNYSFGGIDYVSNQVAEEGAFSVGCDRCNTKWSGYPFGINGGAGAYYPGQPFDGYWYKTQLIETTEKPTCGTLGKGVYKLSGNFKGTLFEGTFENFIPLNPDQHEWNSEGVCQNETHYQYSKLDDGTAKRDGYGNPCYYVNASTKEPIVVTDPLSQAKAYFAEYVTEPITENGVQVTAKDGSQLYYSYWKVISNYSDGLSMFKMYMSGVHSLDANAGVFVNSYMPNYAVNYKGHNLTLDLNGHRVRGFASQNDVQAAGNIEIKNGEFGLVLCNLNAESDDNVTFDNVKATGGISWNTPGGRIVLKNGTVLTDADESVITTLDIDATSKMEVKGGGLSSSKTTTMSGAYEWLHYLPSGWSASGVNNAYLTVYDSDGRIQTTYTLDGANKTDHKQGYFDEGLYNGKYTHYSGCSICGYTSSSSVTHSSHSLNYEGKCSSCSHSMKGAVDLGDGTQIDGCVKCHSQKSGGSLYICDAEPYSKSSEVTSTTLYFDRTFRNGNWQPLYVPFAIPYSVLESAGLRVARLNDTHQYDDDEDGVIDRTEIEAILLKDGSTKPNYPYMVQCTSYSDEDVDVELKLTNLHLYSSKEYSIECSTFERIFKILCTYQGFTGDYMMSNSLYGMSNGSFCPVESATSSLLIKPQRWCLQILDGETRSIIPYESANAASVRIRVSGDEEQPGNETGIVEMLTKEPNTLVYNLNGIMVDEDSDLSTGIYVRHGKKIIVK